MLSTILSLLGFLNPVFKLIGSIFGSISNTEIAKVQADSATGIAEVNAAASVERQWWFVAAMIPFIAFPFGLYIWKAIAWDKVFGPMLGYADRTDSIDGSLGTVFWIVITGIFLHAMVNK